MGWAKYYEDNMSIFIGRMAVKEVAPVICKRYEIKAPAAVAVKAETLKSAQSDKVKKQETAHRTSGRKGLKVVFQNGADEIMIRKMQMNGWWWSKANACWYNHDTKGNRKYAKGLNELGAKVSVVV